MDTLGVVESMSIAAGAELADIMVKAAAVELLRASTVCSGRFLIMTTGDREAVSASVAAAAAAGRALAGSFVISGVAPQVLHALRGKAEAAAGDAVGIVESRNVSSGINAADKAVKRSAAALVRFAAGQGIHGKSFFVLRGDVAAVREGVDAACESLRKYLLEAVVLPRPDASVIRAMAGGKGRQSM